MLYYTSFQIIMLHFIHIFPIIPLIYIPYTPCQLCQPYSSTYWIIFSFMLCFYDTFNDTSFSQNIFLSFVFGVVGNFLQNLPQTFIPHIHALQLHYCDKILGMDTMISCYFLLRKTHNIKHYWNRLYSKLKQLRIQL